MSDYLDMMVLVLATSPFWGVYVYRFYRDMHMDPKELEAREKAEYDERKRLYWEKINRGH